MRTSQLALCAITAMLFGCAAPDRQSAMKQGPVTDSAIASQEELLYQNTAGKGFGPQSPRDLDSAAGNNFRIFSAAPPYTAMNLCNIHFHKNAEHKGGEFTKYAGNGDGQGYQTGYLYSGQLSAAELKPVAGPICPSKHGGLAPGDTLEVHYVHTSTQAKSGPTLGACLSDALKNPQLRVETQVVVLVNDKAAQNFVNLTKHEVQNGLYQAVNIPSNMGTPIQYAGSTTGPSYNKAGSPFQVSWSVRPKVMKVDIETVGTWCKGNVFNEDDAHGVRNLVTNPDLLSRIVR